MRGADCVEIMLFHQTQIPYRLFATDTVTGLRIAVVTIDAFEFYRLPV